ncbi:MAG TPA: biopolymer transporter ExbD [Gemmatales bacterium]|nr:biopolymer transporter ExbD [Gemmatales bacterium]HMP16251.1 biopolymer transporter ExbD [Gemmatales bacterium]
MRKRRRRILQNPDATSEFSSTSIFVTPMLDMAFQILAFFVFTYSPTAAEGQFPIALVRGETAGEETQEKEDKVAPDEPTELKSTLFIEVRARDKGKIGSIKVGGTTLEPDPNESDRTEAWIKALGTEMLRLKELNKTEDRITIKGTPTLRWEEMMRVIDTARRHVDVQTRVTRDLFPRISLGEITQ